MQEHKTIREALNKWMRARRELRRTEAQAHKRRGVHGISEADRALRCKRAAARAAARTADVMLERVARNVARRRVERGKKGGV